MEVKIIKWKKEYFKIYIDKLPHLKICLKHFKGYQSYIEEGKGKKKNINGKIVVGDSYFIKYYFYGSEDIISEYDEKEKWEEILRKIDGLETLQKLKIK